ncbi:hypothetical protein D7V94_05550 [Parablautia intestinalis]|uniref:Uncharacterized protein n=2 Tax=Parablautia intestinalis TaxID=2320100 RepID=A0A3A9ANB9_9FIRM|nr:hypothetical protein D7V94_05550 [Parablautia intestinalis]
MHRGAHKENNAPCAAGREKISPADLKRGWIYIMSKVNANKKLELIKAIRTQNQYNRQLFRSREGFLYSDDPEIRRGEVYELEMPEKTAGQDQGSVFGSFRIRFAIAVILLFCFILCDVNHLSYGDENTDTFFGRITKSFEMKELFEQMENL